MNCNTQNAKIASITEKALFMAEQAERLIGLALEQRRVASKDSYSFGFSGRRLVQGYFKWCRERGYH